MTKLSRRGFLFGTTALVAASSMPAPAVRIVAGPIGGAMTPVGGGLTFGKLRAMIELFERLPRDYDPILMVDTDRLAAALRYLDPETTTKPSTRRRAMPATLRRQTAKGLTQRGQKPAGRL